MNGARTVAAAVRVSSSGRQVKLAERVWQTLAVAAVAALLWWYVEVHREPSADNHRSVVLALGWIGTSLAVLAAALSIRKRLAYQGIGKMSVWLSAHTYLGIVATFAIFFHSGFRLGGALATCLLVFFSLTVASGLMGWWFSRVLPPLLTAMEESPAIQEELVTVRAQCLQGMLELANAGSPEFSALVKGRLMKSAASWRRMFRFYRRRTKLRDELPVFQQENGDALARLNQREHLAYQRASEYALRVNKMNAELLLQRAMRGWLTFHVVATGTMFGLAAVHIFTSLYY